MAERIVVACVQQRMHLPLTLDEYCEDLRRFMRVVVTKQARLVLFPELGGVMVAPPILGDFRSKLLKQYDRGRRRNASMWQRIVGSMSGTMASMMGADFRRGLSALLDVAAPDLWNAYEEVFSGLAREFGVTVVAPSAYLPDPIDGVIRNMSIVFDSNGQVAGRQAKVVLHPADADLAQAGATWDVIATEVGQVGLILGSDVLYPEVGRLLAYRGAELLLVQAACTDEAYYQKIRAGTLARMQDNQLYAAVSFLVGDNLFSRAQRTPFAGKSAILAPQELSPRSNGVLVEMGNLRSEGVLAAQWDFAALRDLWESSETPLRSQLPLQQAGQILAQLYARLQTLPKVATVEQITEGKPGSGTASKGALGEPQSLDDLPVIATITQSWPPPPEALGEVTSSPNASMESLNGPSTDPDFEGDDDFVYTPNEADASVEYVDDSMPSNLMHEAFPYRTSDPASGLSNGEADEGIAESSRKNGEDETDEMDAVAGTDKGR